MSRSDDQRFFTMADVYDKMAPGLVPQYDFIQDEMIRYLDIESRDNPVIVDLGAGSGLFLEKILKLNPTSTCYWIDYSKDFRRVAGERLAQYGDSVKFILSPLEDSWEKKLLRQADFILSMSAIHHLLNYEKKELYRRCHDVIGKGGWFINMDEMKTINTDAYLQSLHHWVDHVENAKANIPEKEIHLYDEWKFHFDKWKFRNVDNWDKTKTKGDDLHEKFDVQMNWLREIGFKKVDVFIKYHLWCAIGGQK